MERIFFSYPNMPKNINIVIKSKLDGDPRLNKKKKKIYIYIYIYIKLSLRNHNINI